MIKELPSKMHKLLDVALKDLMSCARSPKYTIDMSEWHTTYIDTCRVCMAGAVMAKSLEAGHCDTLPGDLPDSSYKRRKWWAAWRKIQKEMERLGV
jgi:hypothetical protein